MPKYIHFIRNQKYFGKYLFRIDSVFIFTVMEQSSAAGLEFKSRHDLGFEVCGWEFDRDFMRFRIGTCEGLWSSTETTYDILAIDNKQPGNGHFEDVLQWFERSCRRDNKSLRFLVIMNSKFMKHLIKKRGFEKINFHDAIKHFH